MRERVILEFLEGEGSALTLVGKCELPFADSMGELDSHERDCCGSERFKPQLCGAAVFDGAVILFNDVVEMAPRSHLNTLPAFILLGEQPKSAMGQKPLQRSPGLPVPTARHRPRPCVRL